MEACTKNEESFESIINPEQYEEARRDGRRLLSHRAIQGALMIHLYRSVRAGAIESCSCGLRTPFPRSRSGDVSCVPAWYDNTSNIGRDDADDGVVLLPAAAPLLLASISVAAIWRKETDNVSPLPHADTHGHSTHPSENRRQ